ncbi:MAG: hypothetical protein MRZ79_05220 [Bacteroidia bacterium]|nr:hypothetical protein [Bacteroidia bacterium]
MKSIKFTLIFAILMGFILVPSCISPCGNDVESFPYFDIKEMRAWAYRSQPERGRLENGESVKYPNLGGIQLAFDVDYLAKQKSWKFSIPSLVSSANACSLIPPGYEGSKEEKLVEVDVITLVDYNGNFPKGSSINEMVVFMENGEEASLEAYLARQVENVKSENLFFTHDQSPDSIIDFAINVSLKFSNGESYTQGISGFQLEP